MADLSYTVEVGGANELGVLAANIDKVTKSLTSGKDNAQKLAEFKAAMGGMGEAGLGIKTLENQLASLKKGFNQSIGGLATVLKQEMAELKAIMATAGAGAGEALYNAIAEKNKKVVLDAKKSGDEIVAANKKTATEQLKIQQDLHKATAAATNKAVADYQAYNSKTGAAGGVKSMRAAGSKVTLEDARAMLGLPSEAEMRTFAAQIKSQMAAALANEKLRARSATSMDLDSTRAMLGMPDRSAMKTFAAQIKSQMSDALSVEKLRVKSAPKLTEDDTRRMLGLPTTAEMKAFSAKLKAEMREAADLERMQLRGSKLGIRSGTITGAFSSYDATKSQTDELSRLEKAAGKANVAGSALAGGFKRLAIDGNDVHSMARGLSSGFNLLWLTWGKLVPLFAGASISFGLKKAFDIGSEVEYTIKQMEMLGQTTSSEGKVIRQALRDIDQTTQFSLLELSKGLVVLGQAGKTPAEALAMLKPAADLASLGMTDLNTTITLLSQTQALYGKSAADAGKMAAQMYDITKSGMLNVEDIGGSMRYASEANTRFGASIEETLVILGSLSNAGIKGAAAGTSYINFMRDLFGRSGPAIKAMKDLETRTGTSIKLFDELGKQRSVVDIFEDIYTAAQKLSSVDADKILGKLLSARGGRSYFAIQRDGIKSLREEVEKLEKVSASSLLEAAKGLMDTTKGAMDVLSGSMVGALDQVFDAHSTKFKGFILDMTKVIDSKEFLQTVYGMVDVVGVLYEKIKTAIPYIIAFGQAWLVFKAASVGIAVFQTLAGIIAGMAPILAMTTGQIVKTTVGLVTSTGAWAANGTAMVGNALASKAAAAGMDTAAVAAARAGATAVVATGAMRGLSIVIGFLANPIVGVITTLGLLGAAFWSTKKDAEAATSGTTQAILDKGKINLEQWRKEIATLQTRNKLLGDAYTSKEIELEGPRAQLKQLQDEQAKRRKDLGAYADIDGPGFESKGQAKMKAKYEAEAIRERQMRTEVNAAQSDIFKARQQDKWRKDQEEIDAAKKVVTNPARPEGVPDVPDTGGGRGGFQPVDLARDKQIENLKRVQKAEAELAKVGYDREKANLDAYRDSKIESEAQYLEKAFALALAYDDKKRKLIVDQNAEEQAAAAKRIAGFKAQMPGAKGQGKAMLQDSIKKEEGAALASAAEAATALAKADSAETLNIVKTITGYNRDLMRTVGENVKFWDKEKSSLDQEESTRKAAQGYLNMAQSINYTADAEKAQQEAIAGTTAKYEAQLDTMQRLRSEKTAALDVVKAARDSTQQRAEMTASAEIKANLLGTTVELDNQISLIQDTLARLDGQIGENVQNTGRFAEAKGKLAYDAVIDAQRASLASMDWTNGVKQSMDELQKQSLDIAGQVKGAFTSMGSSIENAFMKFSETGKFSIKDLANSVIADMQRMAAKTASNGIMQLIANAALQAFGGSSMGSSSYSLAGSSGGGGLGMTGSAGGSGYGLSGGGGLGLKTNALGGVYDSPSLSNYSNGVYDTPQLFGFAKGGVFGEAGPEAIMPLARDSSGSLGVKVNGGGGGGGNNIYLDVEVINNGEPAEATATASEQPDGRILLTMMMSSVADNIAGGGSIKKAIASRFSLKG